ncbi:MAG: GTPase HflX [Firmicutes bacterium]|nr:GTPase HflX [Bacillota bacterium]
MQSSNTQTIQRVLLVGVALEGADITNSLAELESLVYTVGGQVMAVVTQNRQSVDKEFFIGSGKVDEIKELIDDIETEQQVSIDLVIFNNQLSGRQLKNLNEAMNVNIIDRNMLILDIFAWRASSLEGKLQVELAQLKYSLPRLIGQGMVLSQQGAGIGTRGPGETKLELDRRVIRRKIFEKGQEIKKLAEQREVRRKKRLTNEKSVAIVGYTNAGKSTLMNVLTKADVLAEDKLFATLDPITRKIWTDLTSMGIDGGDAGGATYTLTDTVGFIQDLPHEFIEAFKSTLEEARHSDLLLHVVDIASKDVNKDIEVVDKVLAELGVIDKPTIMVFNKIDALEGSRHLSKKLIKLDNIENKNTIYISALTGEGVEELKKQIARKLFS